MAKDKKPQPPLLYTKGWKEERAVYKEQMVFEYRGHPLIEALPPIWSEEEVIERLSYFPRFSEADRDLPTEIRLHIIENSRELFVVQGIHLAIEIKVSRMLRRSLIRRNPSQWHYWTELDSKIAEITRNLERGMFLQTKARGFAIIGVGGVGKSTAVENVLLQYPQVITHTKYGGKDFIFNHLVWLKLDCPQDGSARSVCVNFFRAVDEILGTAYETRYVHDRSSASTLLPQMARVAALHCLGMLVIDEIQNLSEAASGGASQLINYLVQLENTIGVPVILIATDEAKHICCGKFHHARRLSEQGDIIWNPMVERVRKTESEIEEERKATPDGRVELWKPGPVWEEFVRALWDYQYVRKPTTLSDNLLHDELNQALHKYSFGITALASAIFMLAQERAIRTRRETLTKQIIESVGQDSLGLIQEFTEKHRLRGTHKIFGRAAPVQHSVGSAALEPTVDNRLDEASISSGKAIESEPNGKKGQQNALTSPGKGRSRRRKPSLILKDADDIRSLEAAISAGTPVHEAFKNAGHIRASTEFLQETASQ
jgi:AAA domain